MTDQYEPAAMVDTHQHLWKPSERAYQWLEGVGAPLEADFGPELVERDVAAAGITATVVVQAADTYEDTFYMLAVARAVPLIAGVVAWAPLDRPEEAGAALDLYADSAVCGIRVLNHDYADPRWLLRADVAETLTLVANRAFTLDVVSVTPEHLRMIAELAERNPDLTIVIDHLAKPDIAGRAWEPWAGLMADAARHPNVHAKISGLNTVSGTNWSAADWQPYVDLALQHFGSSRLMLGSDWPVATLAGDFAGVWAAQRHVIGMLSSNEQDDILFRTAARVYALDLS